MTLANSLSVDDLILELKIGRATVKFILDRFSAWFSSQFMDGSHQYSSSVIPLMIRISDLLSSGMLPSQIEQILENEIQGPQSQSPGNEVRMNQDALAFIRDMVKDIRGHQGRIAQAEERKAAAIEKRAEAEEKKAQAMNNIAMALQEMGRMRSVDSYTMEVAGQAAQALSLDEDIRPPKDLDDGDLDFDDLDAGGLDFKDLDKDNVKAEIPDDWEEEDFEDPLAGMSELLNHPEPDPTPLESADLDGLTQDMDDLSLLVDEPGLCEADLDDLSALINTVSKTEPENLDALLESENHLPELDDLSQLIDEISESGQGPSELDDLSRLVDAPEDKDETELDDLSLLVDREHPKKSDTMPAEKLDDLWALIDPAPEETTGEAIPMDDLSVLVDPVAQDKNSGDNLWALVDAPVDGKDETTASAPSLRPDITPDQDLNKYKAAVMKIIIELKSLGLSAKETTDRLNKDEVPTLSGKPEWREKAISKIYGFIESTQ